MRRPFLILSLAALAVSACGESDTQDTTIVEIPAAESGAAVDPTQPVDFVEAEGLSAEDEELWKYGQGEAIAEIICSSCHAIRLDDESPHADAPPLRELSRTMRIDDLQPRFAQGIIVDHPDMPEYQFEPEEVDSLIYYIKSLQAVTD